VALLLRLVAGGGRGELWMSRLHLPFPLPVAAAAVVPNASFDDLHVIPSILPVVYLLFCWLERCFGGHVASTPLFRRFFVSLLFSPPVSQECLHAVVLAYSWCCRLLCACAT
jgi:hypothetical protein